MTRHAGVYRESGMDVGEDSGAANSAMSPPASSRPAGSCARGELWREEDRRNGCARAVTGVARAVR